MVEQKCIKCRGYVFWVQIVASFALVVVKFVVGIYGNSNALLADGLHSLANVINSFAIFISHKVGDKPASKTYAFGFGKVEFVVAFAVSFFIILLTLFLVVDSIKALLYQHATVHPHMSVILVAIISVATNETLFKYLQCVGVKFNSASVLASSWAIRADSFTSLAVIVSVILSWFGVLHIDGIMVLVVAVIIFWTSGKCMLEAVQKLMDVAVDPSMMEKFSAALNQISGLNATKMTARYVGPKIWINVAFSLPAGSTVAAFSQTAGEIEKILLQADRHVQRVLVNFND